jgi:DNA-binding NtrC family response regulator
MSAAFSRGGIFRSAAIQEALGALRTAIAHGGGVVISGEPGTGGELFARAIHRASFGDYDGSVEHLIRDEIVGRAALASPLVVVDCSKTADLERRLFGCERGADGPDADLETITPASAIFEAMSGSLLLRDVSEMPYRLQPRVARLLRDGEALLVASGRGGRAVGVTLRAIGTVETAEGHEAGEALHPELARRLGETTIRLPPLRECKADIPGFARHLLAAACMRANVPLKTLSAQAAELLAALPWRGNLVELRQFMEMLVRHVSARLVRLSDVLAHLQLDGRPSVVGYGGTLREARERFEREYVAHVLEQHHGRMAEAAKALGIQRTNLYRKIRRLALELPTRGRRHEDRR